jgi:hypothetical protein
MTAPDRAARLWVALAVATLWRLRVGRALEGGPQPEGTEVPDLRRFLGTTVATPGHPRRLRWLRLGWLWCLACQLTTGSLPMPEPFVPEPWPALALGSPIVTYYPNALQYHEIPKNLPP